MAYRVDTNRDNPTRPPTPTPFFEKLPTKTPMVWFFLPLEKDKKKQNKKKNKKIKNKKEKKKEKRQIKRESKRKRKK